MSLDVLIPLIAAAIGAVGAYFAAIRKLSGTITTSTAEDLWQESRLMRQDLTLRIGQLNSLVDSMQKRIDELLDENSEQAGQITALRDQVASLTKRQTATEEGKS